MKKITLTESQQTVLNNSIPILISSPTLLINGSAGTGKTTLTYYLINKYINHFSLTNTFIFFTAPTNKAVDVLRNSISSKPSIPRTKFLYKTIHSLLNLKRIVLDDGTIEFKPMTPNPNHYFLKKTSLIIIDEASMLSSELLSYINELIASYSQLKVIFLGDEKQINPVNELSTPTFNSNIPTLTLTEIVRQSSDNPIIKLSQNYHNIISLHNDNIIPTSTSIAIPQNILNNNTFLNTTINKKGYLFTNNIIPIVKLLTLSSSKHFPYSIKYLAWTNKDVDYINNTVRCVKYNTLHPDYIYPKETIIMKSSYKDIYHTGKEVLINTLSTKDVTNTINLLTSNSNNIDIKIPNSISSNVRIESNKLVITLPCYIINSICKVVHNSAYYMLLNIKNFLKSILINKKLIIWQSYYNFIEEFADITYSYAITVHKAQGSTYNYVIVNYKDIISNTKKEEVDRLLYTGITRASDIVILYNT